MNVAGMGAVQVSNFSSSAAKHVANACNYTYVYWYIYICFLVDNLYSAWNMVLFPTPIFLSCHTSCGLSCFTTLFLEPVAR